MATNKGIAGVVRRLIRTGLKPQAATEKSNAESALAMAGSRVTMA
ncbi:hypothetical protein [Tunturiibacter gelidiferens]